MAAAPPPAALSTRVELFIEAYGLPRLDVSSATDAFVEVFAQIRGAWTRVDVSEVIRDCSHPKFAKQFVLDYAFEEIQPLRFVLWDYDETSSHDLIGQAEVTLGRIMGSRGSTYGCPLVRTHTVPGAVGTIVVRGSELRAGGNDFLRAGFKASGLDKKDFFGSSDPFLVLSRVRADGSAMKVWESSVVKNNCNPAWPVVDVSIQLLCNGDLDGPLQVECFDWDSDGTHDLIGTARTSVSGILAAAQGARAIPLVHPTKPGKSGNNGLLQMSSAVIMHQPSFLEYIAGGCQLNLVVAIDWTGSNGDPRNPASLHFINPAAPNEYLQAITAVGDILLDYDSDKMVPAYLFGGSIAGRGTQHCAALNMNEANPEVPGVAGIVEAYKAAFNYAGLSGPTYFAPIIQRASEFAAQNVTQTNQRYTVLLIITDGGMNDEDETIRAIVNASGLALSIVIVGVGAADFSAMEVLDADKGALRSGGKAATRDIVQVRARLDAPLSTVEQSRTYCVLSVQFVPFRKYSALGTGAASMLAKEVLKEVPSQLVKFFLSRGIVPNPAPTMPMPAIPGVPPHVGGAAAAVPPPGARV